MENDHGDSQIYGASTSHQRGTHHSFHPARHSGRRATRPRISQELLRTHENYNALYSLALASAINNYSLTLSTTADIEQNDRGFVEDMMVGW